MLLFSKSHDRDLLINKNVCKPFLHILPTALTEHSMVASPALSPNQDRKFHNGVVLVGLFGAKSKTKNGRFGQKLIHKYELLIALL